MLAVIVGIISEFAASVEVGEIIGTVGGADVDRLQASIASASTRKKLQEGFRTIP
jgi:hypothetical protein